MLDMQKRLSKTFYALISLPSTAMGFALSVQISALSWLLSTRYHLELDKIGYVWAAGPAAGILGQLIIGVVSDKAWFWGGRRRPFILIGGTLAALMVFMLPRMEEVAHVFGMSDLVVVGLMVALTLDLSINIGFNPTRAIIADVTPEGAPRTRGYTWMQTISGFWGVMAYLIGAIWDNYALINVAVVVVLLFSLLPMFFITEQKEIAGEAQATATKTNWGQLWRIYVAHGLSWIGVQSMFIFMFAFIQQYLVAPGTPDAAGQTGQITSIAFAVLSTVSFLLPATVLEPMAKRFGRVNTHSLCMAIMAVGYFGIAFMARTPLALYTIMAVVGIGWGAVVSLPFAVMSEKSDRSRMGFFMGVFNLSVVLPQLFVSLTIGKYLVNADKSLLFIICGACLTASAVAWRFVAESSTATAPVQAAPAGH